MANDQETTVDTENSESRIFAYLDECAAAGQKVPTIRAIREAVRVSTNDIGPALKKWKANRAQAETKALEAAGDEILDKSFEEAIALVKKTVATSMQKLRDKYAQDDSDRRTEADRREAELIGQLEIASKQVNETLLMNGRLEGQLIIEEKARKTYQEKVDELREVRNGLESELADIKLTLKKLHDVNASLIEENKKLRKELQIEKEKNQKPTQSW